VNERVSDAIAALIASESGRAVEVRELRPYGGGSINRAARVITTAGDFFAKWNTQVSSQVFRDEAAGLRQLRAAAAGKLVVPEVVGGGGGASGVPPFLVLEHLEHVNHSAAGSSEADARFGTGLAQVHSTSAKYFGRRGDPTPPTTATDWPQHYRDDYLLPVLRRIAAARPLPVSDVEVHMRVCGLLPELLDHQPQPSLVHGDLWHGNYLYSVRGPAIVDPHAAYADREYEFGITLLFGGFSTAFWSAYQDQLPFPPGWQRRNGLYQLYHILNHHLLFGGSYAAAARAMAERYR
jgi:fructosamine-3-kinase